MIISNIAVWLRCCILTLLVAQTKENDAWTKWNGMQFCELHLHSKHVNTVNSKDAILWLVGMGEGTENISLIG